MSDEQTVEASEPIAFAMTTHKPVFFSYPHGDPPSDLHPAGVVAGFTGQVASPEKLFAVHPNAIALRYVDGTPFDAAAARRELRERDALFERALSGDEVARESLIVAGVEVPRKLSERALSDPERVETAMTELRTAADAALAPEAPQDAGRAVAIEPPTEPTTAPDPDKGKRGPSAADKRRAALFGKER